MIAPSMCLDVATCIGAGLTKPAQIKEQRPAYNRISRADIASKLSITHAHPRVESVKVVVSRIFADR